MKYILITIILASCINSPNQFNKKNIPVEPVLKVYLDSNGIIWVNDSAQKSLQELESLVYSTKDKNGSVLYSKDLHSSPPTDSATQILDIFVETQIRVFFPDSP